MGRVAWWAAVHGVPKSRTRLCTSHFHALDEGNGIPLQCSCLENPRDRGAWWAAVCGVAQSQTRLKRLSSSSNSFYIYVLYPTSEPLSVYKARSASHAQFCSGHRTKGMGSPWLRPAMICPEDQGRGKTSSQQDPGVYEGYMGLPHCPLSCLRQECSEYTPSESREPLLSSEASWAPFYGFEAVS